MNNSVLEIDKRFYDFAEPFSTEEECFCGHHPDCLLMAVSREHLTSSITRHRELKTLLGEKMCNCPHSIFCVAENRSVHYHKTTFNNRFSVEKRNFRQVAEWSASARTALLSALGDEVDVVVLNHSSKRPFTHQGKRIVTSNTAVPVWFNYGIRPKEGSTLYIFDLDVPKELPYADRIQHTEQTIDKLSKILEYDVRSALTVRTPSGGLHAYLRLPNGANIHQLPKASLTRHRGLQRLYPEYADIKVDIRSGGTDMYAVGVGSVFENQDGEIGLYSFAAADDKRHHKFLLDGNLTVPELSETAVENLRFMQELSTLIPHGRKRDWSTNVDAGHRKEQAEKLLKTERRGKTTIPKSEMKLLRERIELEQRKGTKFHQQRAIIMSRLFCCYTENTIITVMKNLGVDRDSFRPTKVLESHLVQDFRRFTQKLDKDCVHNRDKKDREPSSSAQHWNMKRDDRAVKIARHYAISVKDSEMIAAVQLKREQRSANRFVKKQMSVLNVAEVFSRLDGRNTKYSQRRKDALLILFSYVHPLMNMGVKNILVSVPNIAKDFGISTSRVSDALRVLREQKIVVVSQKQSLGRLPKYRVVSEVVDKTLTNALWQHFGRSRDKNSESVYCSGVIEMHTGAILQTDGVVESLGENFVELPQLLTSFCKVRNVLVGEILQDSSLVARFIAEEGQKSSFSGKS